MNILEMQVEILKLYAMNEGLMGSFSKLSDIALNIAERNNDIYGQNEVKDILREVYNKLNK